MDRIRRVLRAPNRGRRCTGRQGRRATRSRAHQDRRCENGRCPRTCRCGEDARRSGSRQRVDRRKPPDWGAGQSTPRTGGSERRRESRARLGRRDRLVDLTVLAATRARSGVFAYEDARRSQAASGSWAPASSGRWMIPTADLAAITPISACGHATRSRPPGLWSSSSCTRRRRPSQDLGHPRQRWPRQTRARARHPPTRQNPRLVESRQPGGPPAIREY